MTKKQKLLAKALQGSKNIAFADAVALVEAFGFRLARVSGSHHIYTRVDIPEMVNLQEVDGKVKPYQLKQFLALVEQHNLELESD